MQRNWLAISKKLEINYQQYYPLKAKNRVNAQLTTNEIKQINWNQTRNNWTQRK